jgi:hypothetical protein
MSVSGPWPLHALRRLLEGEDQARQASRVLGLDAARLAPNVRVRRRIAWRGAAGRRAAVEHISGSFGSIVGVYQLCGFMPEMRDAIEKWEKHLSKIAEPI